MDKPTARANIVMSVRAIAAIEHTILLAAKQRIDNHTNPILYSQFDNTITVLDVMLEIEMKKLIERTEAYKNL